MASPLVQAVAPLVHALDTMGVEYLIGGSVASSTYGLPRSTMDVDTVLSLEHRHVPELVQQLGTTYYIDADMIRDALDRQSSFNIIHLDTMIKIDVFVLKDQPFDKMAFSRRRLDKLEDAPDSPKFYFSTAEDVILHKLLWYRQGGETSHQQWQDLTGIVKVQGDALDHAYLEKWAAKLGLKDLLDRASTTAPDQPLEPS
jgi:hypothetical protein